MNISMSSPAWPSFKRAGMPQAAVRFGNDNAEDVSGRNPFDIVNSRPAVKADFENAMADFGGQLRKTSDFLDKYVSSRNVACLSAKGTEFNADELAKVLEYSGESVYPAGREIAFLASMPAMTFTRCLNKFNLLQDITPLLKFREPDGDPLGDLLVQLVQNKETKAQAGGNSGIISLSSDTTYKSAKKLLYARKLFMAAKNYPERWEAVTKLVSEKMAEFSQKEPDAAATFGYATWQSAVSGGQGDWLFGLDKY